MINKTSISISAKVADLLTSLVGNTLSEEDKSQLYETVFDFYRDLLRGYDSETINENSRTTKRCNMVKGNFIEVVNSLEAINSRCFKLSEMGIDIADSDIVSNAECIAMAIFKENYTDEGIDWIMWWVYEKAGDPDIKAYDEEGKEIISTLDELYEYVESSYKIV